MYLLDTNIWLERLLNQDRSDEVGQFLALIPADELFMTVFSFHSIGLILSRLGLRELLLRFVQDTLIDGAVELLILQPEAMQELVDVMTAYNLDFDDAYQYVIAEGMI